MTIRRGLGKGKGSGYYNLIGIDPRVHSDSARGRRQPQRMPVMLKKGDKVTSRFTDAKGRVVATKPFAVEYDYKGRKYRRYSNPKYWKGGKLESRFTNYNIYRVGKTPPKGTKIRIQDIGRKGHSLRMAYYKDGKWHTYQFLISKADAGSAKTQKLVSQIKSKYPNVRGGKDMPVKEVDEILAELPKDTEVENKSRLPAIAAAVGSAIGSTAKRTAKAVREYQLAQKEKRLREIAEAKEDLRPEIQKLEAQHNRVESLKSQIATQEDKGMDTDKEIEELEEEMEQLRELQERATQINVRDLSNNELRILAKALCQTF